MTRHLLTILFSFTFYISFAQTSFSDKESENIIVDTFYLKRAEFISLGWNGLKIIDTVKNLKDTLIINFQNNNGFIRQQIDIKNDTGCIREAITKYINSRQLLIYSEHWTFACQNTDPNDYDGVLDTYKRFSYDKLGRLNSKFVMDSSSKTWRYDYSYDENGNSSVKPHKITRNEFWTECCR